MKLLSNAVVETFDISHHCISEKDQFFRERHVYLNFFLGLNLLYVCSLKAISSTCALVGGRECNRIRTDFATKH